MNNFDTLFDIAEPKFDIIIGNPPYQNPSKAMSKVGGANSFWRKFLKLSFHLVAEDGYVSMVCPGFPAGAQDIGHHLTNNTPLLLINDARHYFEVGTDIKWWIVQQGRHNKPFIVDGEIWDDINNDPTYPKLYYSIKHKTLDTHPLFECVTELDYKTNGFKDYYSKEKTDHHKYRVRHASRIWYVWVPKPTPSHNLSKLIMTFSGNPNYEYSDKDNPMGTSHRMSGYILVKDKYESDLLIHLYNTKLYRYFRSINDKGFKSKWSYSMPKLKLDHKWTDAELYKYFKLTKGEINEIETTVKT